MRTPARIVLVDDHWMVLDGLRRLLEEECDGASVRAVADGASALKALQWEAADLLITDYRLPDMDGLALIRAARKVPPATRAILLSAELSNSRLREAAALRVEGVIWKDEAPSLLVQCIRAVLAGRTYFNERMGKALAGDRFHQQTANAAGPEKLTQREIEISQLAAQGLRTREIGDVLGISAGTVKIHLHSIYEKLEVATRVELANLIR